MAGSDELREVAESVEYGVNSAIRQSPIDNRQCDVHAAVTVEGAVYVQAKINQKHTAEGLFTAAAAVTRGVLDVLDEQQRNRNAEGAYTDDIESDMPPTVGMVIDDAAYQWEVEESWSDFSRPRLTAVVAGELTKIA